MTVASGTYNSRSRKKGFENEAALKEGSKPVEPVAEEDEVRVGQPAAGVDAVE